MDTENLRSFLEVATHGSFTVAASRLNLAQSTVSARIRGLEEQLGRRLFVRDRDGVTLTPAGRQFLPHASSITRTWEQSRQDIAVPDGYETLLRLTAPAYLWDRITSSWIAWMRERRPNVALRLEGSFPDQAIDQLAEGLLDICILYLPRPHPGIVYETLAVDQVVLVQHAAQTEAMDRELHSHGLGAGIPHRARPRLCRHGQAGDIGRAGVHRSAACAVAAGGRLSAAQRRQRPYRARRDAAHRECAGVPAADLSRLSRATRSRRTRSMSRSTDCARWPATGRKVRALPKATVSSAWPDYVSGLASRQAGRLAASAPAALPVPHRGYGSGSRGRARPRPAAAPAPRRSRRSCAGSACGRRSPTAGWWRSGFRRRAGCAPSRVRSSLGTADSSASV